MSHLNILLWIDLLDCFVLNVHKLKFFKLLSVQYLKHCIQVRKKKFGCSNKHQTLKVTKKSKRVCFCQVMQKRKKILYIYKTCGSFREAKSNHFNSPKYLKLEYFNAVVFKYSVVTIRFFFFKSVILAFICFHTKQLSFSYKTKLLWFYVSDSREKLHSDLSDK